MASLTIHLSPELLDAMHKLERDIKLARRRAFLLALKDLKVSGYSEGFDDGWNAREASQ